MVHYMHHPFPGNMIPGEQRKPMGKIYASLIFSSFIFLLTIAAACNKNNPLTPVTIKLTDAPGPYSEVNIDLQSVEIIDQNGATVNLSTRAGIYNLLDFTNGKDTIIATGALDAGDVEQIRLILGPNNTVVSDSITYPLSTPSAQQSGLKLQVHQKLEAGVDYQIVLDFDANQSIVAKGNGSFSLKPVLRCVENALSGSIKGNIKPVGVLASITATFNGISYSTNTDIMGNFVIKGLPAGTYEVVITPAFPLTPVTIHNVSVNIGTATDLGVTTF